MNLTRERMTGREFVETVNPPIIRHGFVVMCGNEPLSLANELNMKIPGYEPKFPRGDFYYD